MSARTAHRGIRNIGSGETESSYVEFEVRKSPHTQRHNAQRLHTLEQCLARLLEIDTPPANPSAPAADMELRLHELFEELNHDALRLQADYYAERRHLQELDQHRRADLVEIVHTS